MRACLMALAAGFVLAACGTPLDPKYEMFYAPCHAYEGFCAR